MNEFGISANQVVVLPRPAEKKKAVYCKESEVIMKRFFKIYKDKMSPKIVMFRDNANFFPKVCDSLINERLLEKSVEYPAAIHQHLSPNDNTLHGEAKSTWRHSTHYEREGVKDVESSLCLLSLLGGFKPETVGNRFQKNFLLDKLTKNITQKECEELIANSSGVNEARKEFFANTKRVYDQWVSGKTSRRFPKQPTPPSMLPSNLDGDYWTIFE